MFATRFEKDHLLDLCVEICLPPLQLIDGKCLDVNFGVATDLVDGLGLGDLAGGLTEGLGLGGIL